MNIPEPIAAFLEAIKKHDSERLLASIADTALIHDEGQDYRGLKEIKKWSDEKVFAPKVTLNPISMNLRDDKTIVTMKVEGNFDKTGLPDPLLLDFHFVIDATEVTALSIHFPEQK
jgi:hypothetical protein